jgi:DNA polymerase-1
MGLADRSGRPTGAVYGFTNTVFRILKEEAPDHLAVAFDPPGPTFRHAKYAEYKATRQKMPEELVAQMPLVRDVVRAMGYPVLEVPGWEADDVLATVARRASAAGVRVFLVTGDKDLFQLVDDRVSIYNVTGRGTEPPEVLDAKGVEEKFGVPPAQVPDVLALMGDSSDNVPGVRGIGPKTAVELVRRFGSLDQVLARASEIEKPKIREALLADADSARLSYDLVKIPCDAPVELSFEDAAVEPPDPDRVGPLFEELGFRRLVSELPRPAAPPEQGRRYRTVRSPADLEALLAELRVAPLFTFDTETTGTDPMQAAPVGLSFSTGPLSAWYVPLNLDPPLFGGAPGSDAPRVLETLRPLLEDPSRAKAGQNSKYDLLIYRCAGLRPAGLAHDTMVLSFLLDPQERTHNLDDLAQRHLGLRKIPTTDLIGRGKDQITMDRVPVERVAEYACEDADATLRVLRALEPRLAGSGVERLYRDVEMPLVGVLADMEERGIRVDGAALERMGADLKAREEGLAAAIRALAEDGKLNVNSTQQLGVVLFERMQVQGKRKAKRTKTGYRTDVETLEQFSEHEIVRKILEYRTCAKLRSTYLEPLPRLVNPRTGRLHTSFSQIGAITGRLSSSDPNLQNIPVRTEEGRAIRRCFVPGEPGWRLVSADYSQIELRVLAHLAEDPGFLSAFRSGEDIHRATAARIFGLLPGAVTAELRGRAKAINFGVIYGMGEQRLARETGITVKEAREFIEAYFRTYPRVRAFHEEMLAKAREVGYVETLLGRRRWIRDELESADGGVAANARNNAINTPIQGTAADIVKVAMVRVHRRLAASRLDAHLLLQVHDELVLECPAKQVAPLTALLKEEMEHAVDLKVPLLVEVGAGDDWLEAH